MLFSSSVSMDIEDLSFFLFMAVFYFLFFLNFILFLNFT